MECIVISVRKQDGILRAGVEIRCGKIAHRVTISAGVVIPSYFSHEAWNGKKANCGCKDSAPFFVRHFFAEKLPDGGNTQPNPHGECIRGSSIRIIPLAWLIRILIQINYNGKSGKNKCEKYNKPVFFITLKLKHEPDQSENKRKAIKFIVRFALCYTFRKMVLRAETHFVQERNSADPVSFDAAGIFYTVPLNIILPACKIPHEIPHKHMHHLVVPEVSKIFPESGLHYCLIFSCARIPGLDGYSFYIRPGFISALMACLLAPHAGKRGAKAFVVIWNLIVAVINYHIFSCFVIPRIDRITIYVVRGLVVFTDTIDRKSSRIVIVSVVERSVVILPVHNRPIAILLAVQIGEQTDRVLGIIFVNGRVCF